MSFDKFLGHNQPTEIMPEFLAPLDNLTVTQGRDVSFTCVVNDLGAYRVRYEIYVESNILSRVKKKNKLKKSQDI